jgi:predicted lactoylglutathione lyase
MVKELWINLPVKDVKRSKAFFTSLGFEFITNYGDTADSACLIVGTKKTTVMLFSEKMFEGFNQFPITDSSKSSGVLFSFDVESREEIDELARKVEEAGGVLFGKPAENMGWMYGCAFTDLDGHRWNALYMDMDKMPKQ